MGNAIYEVGKFKVWTIQEHEKGNPVPDWLVEDLIPANEQILLYAWAGHLKSFVGIHLAHCIATGMPFNGKPVSQGEVVYVAAESPNILRDRMIAWEKYFGKKAGVHFIDYPVQASSGNSMKLLRDFIVSRQGKVKLVIFDTISRCSVGVDENSPTEVDNWVNASIDALIKDCNVSVLMLHHRGASGTRRPRGCTAWTGWASTVIYVEATFDNEGYPVMVDLDVEKQRSEKKIKMTFTPARAYDHLVLLDRYTEKKEETAPPKPRITNNRKILDALEAEPGQTYQEIADSLFDGNVSAAKSALSRCSSAQSINYRWYIKKKKK